MKIAEIRAHNPYAFRSGEWARIIGIQLHMTPDGTQRWCYTVQWWYDKKTDIWPIVDGVASYEFRERDE